MVNIFTDTTEIELLGHIPVYMALGIESLAALFLGGLIGIDRELKIKAAGLKTNIMICFGSMVFTAMSLMNLIGFEGIADPNRISAQIVSGIGFLGAGAIMQGRNKDSITGLTTAATIWVVAAIGYTIGTGHPISAAFYTGTVLLILNVIDPITEAFVNLKSNPFHLEVLSRGPISPFILQICKRHDIELVYDTEENLSEFPWVLYTAYLKTNAKTLSVAQGDVMKLIKVKEVSFRQLDSLPEFVKSSDDKLSA